MLVSQDGTGLVEMVGVLTVAIGLILVATAIYKPC
jgi:hypothetical protein